MRDRAAGIIIKEEKILLFDRIKKGDHYYALPGGTIEAGETPDQAVVRELEEELQITDIVAERVFDIQNMGRTEYYYLVRSFVGEPTLGGPELEIHSPDNSYILIWQEMSDFENSSLVRPDGITKKIMDLYASGK